jgi:hypothetical protein
MSTLNSESNLYALDFGIIQNIVSSLLFLVVGFSNIILIVGPRDLPAGLDLGVSMSNRST